MIHITQAEQLRRDKEEAKLQHLVEEKREQCQEQRHQRQRHQYHLGVPHLERCAQVQQQQPNFQQWRSSSCISTGTRTCWSQSVAIIGGCNNSFLFRRSYLIAVFIYVVHPNLAAFVPAVGRTKGWWKRYTDGRANRGPEPYYCSRRHCCTRNATINNCSNISSIRSNSRTKTDGNVSGYIPLDPCAKSSYCSSGSSCSVVGRNISRSRSDSRTTGNKSTVFFRSTGSNRRCMSSSTCTSRSIVYQREEGSNTWRFTISFQNISSRAGDISRCRNIIHTPSVRNSSCGSFTSRDTAPRGSNSAPVSRCLRPERCVCDNRNINRGGCSDIFLASSKQRSLSCACEEVFVFANKRSCKEGRLPNSEKERDRSTNSKESDRSSRSERERSGTSRRGEKKRSDRGRNTTDRSSCSNSRSKKVCRRRRRCTKENSNSSRSKKKSDKRGKNKEEDTNSSSREKGRKSSSGSQKESSGSSVRRRPGRSKRKNKFGRSFFCRVLGFTHSRREENRDVLPFTKKQQEKKITGVLPPVRKEHEKKDIDILPLAKKQQEKRDTDMLQYTEKEKERVRELVEYEKQRNPLAMAKLYAAGDGIEGRRGDTCLGRQRQKILIANTSADKTATTVAPPKNRRTARGRVGQSVTVGAVNAKEETAGGDVSATDSATTRERITLMKETRVSENTVTVGEREDQYHFLKGRIRAGRRRGHILKGDTEGGAAEAHSTAGGEAAEFIGVRKTNTSGSVSVRPKATENIVQGLASAVAARRTEEEEKEGAEVGRKGFASEGRETVTATEQTTAIITGKQDRARRRVRSVGAFCAVATQHPPNTSVATAVSAGDREVATATGDIDSTTGGLPTATTSSVDVNSQTVAAVFVKIPQDVRDEGKEANKRSRRNSIRTGHIFAKSHSSVEENLNFALKSCTSAVLQSIRADEEGAEATVGKRGRRQTRDPSDPALAAPLLSEAENTVGAAVSSHKRSSVKHNSEHRTTSEDYSKSATSSCTSSDNNRNHDSKGNTGNTSRSNVSGMLSGSSSGNCSRNNNGKARQRFSAGKNEQYETVEDRNNIESTASSCKVIEGNRVMHAALHALLDEKVYKHSFTSRKATFSTQRIHVDAADGRGDNNNASTSAQRNIVNREKNDKNSTSLPITDNRKRSTSVSSSTASSRESTSKNKEDRKILTKYNSRPSPTTSESKELRMEKGEREDVVCRQSSEVGPSGFADIKEERINSGRFLEGEEEQERSYFVAAGLKRKKRLRQASTCAAAAADDERSSSMSSRRHNTSSKNDRETAAEEEFNNTGGGGRRGQKKKEDKTKTAEKEEQVKLPDDFYQVWNAIKQMREEVIRRCSTHRRR